MNRIAEYFGGTIARPSRTFQRILTERSISVGAVPVVVFGAFAGVTYFVSYLYGAVGGYEPFIPIPKEVYRLWEAFFILPLYLAAWVLTAGLARTAGKTLGGAGSLKDNLNVLGYSYFVPLLFFAVADFFLIGPAYSWKLAAISGLYGPMIQGLAKALDILYVAVPFGILAPAFTLVAIKNIQRVNSRKALAITAIALIPANMLFALIW